MKTFNLVCCLLFLLMTVSARPSTTAPCPTDILFIKLQEKLFMPRTLAGNSTQINTAKQESYWIWGNIIPQKSRNTVSDILETCRQRLLSTQTLNKSTLWPDVCLTLTCSNENGGIKSELIFYPNLLHKTVSIDSGYYIDSSLILKSMLYCYPEFVDPQAPVWEWDKSLAVYWAWEPFGRWWKLKEEELTEVKAYNDQKIETFLKGLEKTWENPKYDYLFKEKKFNLKDNIIRIYYHIDKLEKLWKKFSDNWDKKNPDKVPKVKVIPL